MAAHFGRGCNLRGRMSLRGRGLVLHPKPQTRQEASHGQSSTRHHHNRFVPDRLDPHAARFSASGRHDDRRGQPHPSAQPLRGRACFQPKVDPDAGQWPPGDAEYAAKILAKKLKLDESAIQTYDGAPKATAGAIVLALASAGKLPATEAPKKDGYTVTYTGGIVVWGARPRSLLYAAGEPEHWAAAKAASYRRNPDYTIRTAEWHRDYPVAEQTAIFGANMYTANLAASPTLQTLPEVFAQLSADQQKSLVAAVETHKTQNAERVKEFHDADVDVFRCCRMAIPSRRGPGTCMLRC